MTAGEAPGWRWEGARGLDRVARAVAIDWAIPLGPRYEGARYSFAAPAGDRAVLKITPAADTDADHDADALEVWDGRGAVRLLRRDRERRAMLIERCVPGDDASTLDDDEAIRVALGVGRRLWRPVTGGPFRRAGDEMVRWLRDLGRQSDHSYLAVATKLFASMDLRHDVLVHGDFHHHNLLRQGGGWLAIDPKPLIAEPEFDVVTLLWNPLRLVVTPAVTERRIRQLAAAGLDERRIRDWAIVRGTQLGLPLHPDEDEARARQLGVVRWLLEARATAS